MDYDQKYLSADDYQAMKAFKNSYAYWQGVGGEAGQRGMKAAHDGAQALRAAAGYQALEDGSGYVPLARRYQQEEAPEYEGSQWDDTLDRVANRLIGMNYADWTQGDQYQALADRYGQQGRMSMQDVMGQISSRTGGLASSYAGTVAQQQYNNYMTKLEEAAREMYSSERQDLAQNASLASSLAQQDYGRYQDRLAQFNADRALDYNAWQDWQNRVTDAVVRQEEKERTDYQDILTRALQAAEYGDYRYLNALGIDTSDNQRDLGAEDAGAGGRLEPGPGSLEPRLSDRQGCGGQRDQVGQRGRGPAERRHQPTERCHQPAERRHQAGPAQPHHPEGRRQQQQHLVQAAAGPGEGRSGDGQL